ncbi:MAG TPA: transglutaminase family protein [Pseudoxanthomonas sp.]|nr:transglutaminase family protein [Pseudoxanthomonas sp.]
MRVLLLTLAAMFASGLSNANAAAPARESSTSQPSTTSQLASLRTLLQAPDSRIDLAQAKLAIDRMIDQKIDEAATLRQLDILATRIKARFPVGANDAVKMELLLASLRQPGPWNDYRPFSYDLDDPFGKDIRNKLMSTYLASRKGNCVSMPVLLVILGQKLELNITLATAPEHVLAKFHNPFDNKWVNVEATSFGFKLDSSYQREGGITPLAMKNRIYLRPLSKSEAVVVMAGTLLEFYGRQGQQDRRIAVADLLLQTDPKDVSTMLQKGNAYFRMAKERYLSKYQSLEEMSPAQRQELETLQHNNDLWFDKAEALGWTIPTQTRNANYLQHIQRIRAAQQGGQ